MSRIVLPVESWVLSGLEHVVDEGKALEAWRLLVLAQGWSQVGEPEIWGRRVAGRVVKYPNVSVPEGFHHYAIEVAR